jgi:hypothetical protein
MLFGSGESCLNVRSMENFSSAIENFEAVNLDAVSHMRPQGCMVTTIFPSSKESGQAHMAIGPGPSSMALFGPNRVQRRKAIGAAPSIYDARNGVRATVPPKKITLRGESKRFSFAFSPSPLRPGIYRIDLLWDGRPAWRTFIRISE